MEHERKLRTMHESRESSTSPGDQGRGKNNDKKASESRSASQTDFERSEAKKTEPGDTGDGAASKTGSSSDVLDFLKTTVGENTDKDASGQPKVGSVERKGYRKSASSKRGDLSEQKLGKVNTEGLFNAKEVLQNLKERGRGNKTVDSVVRDKVQVMVDQWQTENRPRVNLVTGIINERRLALDYPTIKLAAKLEKALDRKKLERSNLLGISEKLSEGGLRDAFLGEHGDSTIQMQKDLESLKETFPKNPDEVITRRYDINKECNDKAQAMVDQWQTENRQDADQVNQAMVSRYFGSVIRKAIALEKAGTDVISVKESLQDAEKQLPKSPQDVLDKEKEQNPSSFTGEAARFFRDAARRR